MPIPVQRKQEFLIAYGNAYLQKNNLPLRLDIGGVCNGMSTVYVKYFLEKKGLLFLDMIERAIRSAFDSTISIETNNFIVEIVLTAFPRQFNKHLSQMTAHKVLSINGTVLQMPYSLGLVTTDENWEKIIQKINLREDEAMTISSIFHKVVLTRENNSYMLYNPNASDYIKLNNENELIQHLHHSAFKFIPGNLGLLIGIIKHPDSPLREYPLVTNIYSCYLNKENIHLKAIQKVYLPPNFNEKEENVNTLGYAIQTNDAGAISYLIGLMNDRENSLRLLTSQESHSSPYFTGLNDNQTSFEMLHLVMFAAKNGFDQSLEVILNNTNNLTIYFIVIYFSLSEGCLETFKMFLKNEKRRLFFESVIKNEIDLSTLDQKHILNCTAESLFAAAAMGGNVVLLEQIIQHYKKHSINLKECIFYDETTNNPCIIKYQLNENAIIAAIKSGSVSCTKLILAELNSVNIQLNDSHYMVFLNEAIKKNDYEMVLFFLPLIQSLNNLNNLNSLNFIEDTDYSILLLLKENNAPFSAISSALIDQKGRKALSMTMGLCVDLYKSINVFSRQIDECKTVIYGFFSRNKTIAEKRESKEIKPQKAPMQSNQI